MNEIIVEDLDPATVVVVKTYANASTKITVDGQRVTEPTKVIYKGIVRGIDMAGTEESRTC